MENIVWAISVSQTILCAFVHVSNRRELPSAIYFVIPKEVGFENIISQASNPIYKFILQICLFQGPIQSWRNLHEKTQNIADNQFKKVFYGWSDFFLN